MSTTGEHWSELNKRSDQTHWVGVGRHAVRLGLRLERALTGKPVLDVWIRQGYQAEVREEERCLQEEYEFIKEKVAEIN